MRNFCLILFLGWLTGCATSQQSLALKGHRLNGEEAREWFRNHPRANFYSRNGHYLGSDCDENISFEKSGKAWNSVCGIACHIYAGRYSIKTSGIVRVGFEDHWKWPDMYLYADGLDAFLLPTDQEFLVKTEGHTGVVKPMPIESIWPFRYQPKKSGG